MDAIKAADGTLVTEKMMKRWTDALDKDEWPKGEYSVGKVIIGRPPLSVEGSAVLSVKVPLAMKRAIEREAKSSGLTTSDYVRTIIASELVH